MPEWLDEWAAPALRMRPRFGPLTSPPAALLREYTVDSLYTYHYYSYAYNRLIDNKPNSPFGAYSGGGAPYSFSRQTSDTVSRRNDVILNGRSYVSFDSTAAGWGDGPCHTRGRDCGVSVASGSFFILQSELGSTPGDDFTGLSLLVDHIRLQDATASEPMLFMFAPLVDGVLGESGVYVRSNRPFQNKSAGWYPYSNGGYYIERRLPVSYSRVVLPQTLVVFETGLMSNGSFSPQSRKFAWTTESWWQVRACVAEGGLFVVSFGERYPFFINEQYDAADYVDNRTTVAAQSVTDLSFSFTPESVDHAVLIENSGGIYSEWDYGASCAPLKTRVADHAAIEGISFLSGLYAWSFSYDSGSYDSLVRNAEYWKSFPNSRHPMEIHRDSSPLPTFVSQETSSGPCPTLQVSVEPQQPSSPSYVSPYPTGETQAKTSCIAAHSNIVSALPISASSLYADVSPADGSLVVAGKKVLSIELTFTPYVAPTLFYESTLSLPTGISQSVEGPPPAMGGGWRYLSSIGDSSSVGWLNYEGYYGGLTSGEWWVKSSTVNMPTPGESWYSQAPPAAHNGRLWLAAVPWPSTLSKTDYAEFRPLTREEHDNIVFHEHLRLTSTIQGQPGKTDADTIKDKGYLGIAPLVGSYTLSRFSIGDVPAAGNVFRFAGAGVWGLDRSVDYNFTLSSKSVSQAYSVRGYSYSTGVPLYLLTTTVLQEPASVVDVTEEWSLSASHVEIYASLATGLQEQGELSTDTSRPDEDEIRSPDVPKGRASSSFVIHEPDKPPRPTITLSLAARTVMRGDLSMTVTAPEEMSFPYTFSSKASTVESMCRGSSTQNVAYVDASGPNGVQSQTTHLDHQHAQFSPMSFNGAQTSRLLAGETVTATWWTDKRDGTEGRPVIIRLGTDYIPLGPGYTTQKLPRMYSVSLKLNLADL